MSDDLISRAAAIGRAVEIPLFGKLVKVVGVSELESLPSAQPETHEERTETHACDLISRQAAIDVEGLDEEIRCEMCRNPMHTNRGCDGNCKYDEKLYEKIIQLLDKRITPLPSAQPEQLTDNEKRIFLAAMTREELICLQLDEEFNDPNLVNLVEICHEITRKVKGALWMI